MSNDYPDVPISKRNSQSAYERDEPTFRQTATYMAIITAILVAFAVAMEIAAPVEQRAPTGIGGSDRGMR